jgi:zinc protease
MTAVFILLAALVVFISPAWAGNTEEFTVNGLKVILKKNTANQVVAAQLYIRDGVLNLTPELAGVEPLLFDAAKQGTLKYPKEKINAELARIGTQIGSDVTRDYSVIQMRCVKTYFDLSWDIFSEVILNPALDPQEVELSRDQLLNALRQRQDNPDSYLEWLGEAQFYKNHPYALDPLGTEETVSKITVAQMRQYLKDNLLASKLLLVVVGNIDRAELQSKVASAFGQLPVGNYKPQPPRMVKHERAGVHTEAQELPTNYIGGYFAAPSLRDKDYFAMRTAVAILNDRIFEEVRTKRNLSYAPSAELEDLFANYGKLYVTTVSPDTTIKVMLAEVRRLQNRMLHAGALGGRINLANTSYYLENETNLAQATFLGRFELSGAGWKASEKFVKNRLKVTPEQIMEAALRYMNNIQFVVIGNPAQINEKVFTSQ